MRRPTSSCSQGATGGAACCQRCAAMGSMVGGRKSDMVRARLKRRAVYWPYAFKRRPVAICPPAPTMLGLPYLGPRRAAVRGVLGHVCAPWPIGPTALHRLRLGLAPGVQRPALRCLPAPTAAVAGVPCVGGLRLPLGRSAHALETAPAARAGPAHCPLAGR